MTLRGVVVPRRDSRVVDIIQQQKQALATCIQAYQDAQKARQNAEKEDLIEFSEESSNVLQIATNEEKRCHHELMALLTVQKEEQEQRLKAFDSKMATLEGDVAVEFESAISMEEAIMKKSSNTMDDDSISMSLNNSGALGMTIRRLETQETNRRALIKNVVPDGQADKAGIQAGDVVEATYEEASQWKDKPRPVTFRILRQPPSVQLEKRQPSNATDSSLAKGVEEADSSEAPSKPAADQTNVIGTSKSGDSDETDAKKADEEAKKPAAKPRKKRKTPETDWESPAPEQEEEPQKEEALKTPAKKRAIGRTAKKRATGRKATAAQPEEEEPENDDTKKTPAKKRTRVPMQESAMDRKRTRAAVAAQSSPEKEPVRVLMTAVGETDEHKKMVTTIGAVLVEKVEDAHTATHVIAGDDTNSLRRTPKLMIGMCRTSKIVHMDWLTESAKAREPLACSNYLLLKDTKAENKYDFVMRESVKNGDTLRRNGEFLFSGYWVFVCEGVAGNDAPPAKELELIVNAAGATWLSSISARAMKGVDAKKLIIITPESPPKKKTKTPESKGVQKAVKNGASSHPASWLFKRIINQSHDE